MKRFFRSVLLIAFAILLVNVSRVSAVGEVTAIEGASIRLQSESAGQGLRFYARLDESMKANEHGFYLVYGKATVTELEDAIVEAGSGDIMLNGKKVFKVVVPAVTAENEFSVVLLGIPEEGYFDKLTAIPYVVNGGAEIYPAVHYKRSVAEVALNMANAGMDISGILGINTIVETTKKKSGYNHDDNIEISSGIYELNHKYLAVEFLKDWNEKFNLELENLEADAFYASAIVGLEGTIGTNKNLSAGNLYKFFNDTRLKAKWGWFLEYLKSVDGTTHPSRQIVAIQGDGTNGDYVLYYGLHLSYSITNFFNREHETGNYTAINFIDGTKYATIKDYNNKVYVDASKYDFHNVGDTIALPAAATPPAGYSFTNYLIDGTSYNAGADYVITTDDVVVEPVFTLIEYAVIFYDGENELTDLNTTYNIVNGLPSLPAYSKEGYAFLGWYDNALFDGSAITSIPSGSTGHKVYYAKTVEAANAPVPITYNLDGGNFYKYESREAMVADFMLDFNAYFFDKDDIVASEFQEKTYEWNVYTFFTAETYAAKWGWMRTYMIQVATDQSHASASNLQSNNDAFWRSSIDSFLNETVRTDWPASADYSVEPAKNGFWHLLVNDVAEEYEYATTLVLPIPVKFGSTFAGWYYEVDFSGTVVTQIEEATTETIVLYAKWE